MDTLSYTKIIARHADTLRLLRKKKVLIVSGVCAGGLLDDAKLAEKNASLFGDNDEAAFDALLSVDSILSRPDPVLIDFKKAVGLFTDSSLAGAEKTGTALLMSRIDFMGTDGIRGKVAPDSDTDCISRFLTDAAFTPGLVETACFSFAAMLVDGGVLKAGESVAVGNDGRDAAFGRVLERAMTDGFNRASLHVLDIGTAPTALVPCTMLLKGYRGGAMLTASHNPSNQNGVKFFLDAKKLLPEGAFGDYVLSAYMYYYRRYAKLPEKNGNVRRHGTTVGDGARLVCSALPPNSADLLAGLDLVLDNANGASADLGRKVLDGLGVSWTTKNETPAGTNINRNCGVAEIEGAESFAGSAYDAHIPFIRELLDKGRACGGEGRVFGISLDGDGDRGFLLYYDGKADCVHVIDGDKCGYILARYFIAKNVLDPRDFWFISTIESDLMTARSAEKNLGLRSKVVSVGDKWIGNFKDGPMLVGLEISGHVIFPVRVRNEKGNDVTLLSGNGLLTGLLTLVAIREMRLGAEEIIRPFEPGFSKTFYCFFVDKSKFYRNSGVWKADVDLVEASVGELRKEGALSADMRTVREEKEDQNVLYISLVNGQGLQGCVFMRNSGTEDKAATYVKGHPGIRDALLAIGRRVQDNHIRLLKNKTRAEYAYETSIMSLLQDDSEHDMSDVGTAYEKETRSKINGNDLSGVLHGLKKEGRIVMRQTGATTMIRRAQSGDMDRA
jgi:phosphoglucosamine mutase